MSVRCFILIATVFGSSLTGGLQAQKAAEADRELSVLESRLQEQRAQAVIARLTLYTDELLKLHTQFTSASESIPATAVKQEIDAARAAIKRLTLITRGETEPPSLDEVRAGEEVSDTVLAAKRIDTIIARFTLARSDGFGSTLPSVAGQARPRILKFDKTSRNRDYTGSDDAEYWSYKSNGAIWTVDDIVPGDYEVIVRYSAKPDAGGKAVIKAAGQTLELTVPPGEKGQGQKELRLNAGVVRIKEPGVDIRVENGGLANGAEYLWNLEAVILQPTGKRP